MRRLATLEDKAAAFWAKVEKTDTCWLWMATKDSDGYGLVSYRYPTRLTMHAHRMAVILAGVKISAKIKVLHKLECPNRNCVRWPKHLYLGTQADNMRDCLKAGKNHFANKTTCPNGHQYSPENTYVTSKGSRMCRRCLYLRGAQRRKEKSNAV